ncbi:hypothetical protein B0H11DRAFT_2291788 [Mycena galericulata]|nr:hypothetical protein B0H11DRAFT_2291788 [Mycena galericulata]
MSTSPSSSSLPPVPDARESQRKANELHQQAAKAETHSAYLSGLAASVTGSFGRFILEENASLEAGLTAYNAARANATANTAIPAVGTANGNASTVAAPLPVIPTIATAPPSNPISVTLASSAGANSNANASRTSTVNRTDVSATGAPSGSKRRREESANSSTGGGDSPPNKRVAVEDGGASGDSEASAQGVGSSAEASGGDES